VFSSKRLKRQFLEELVNNSEVHEIESTSVPFSPNDDNRGDGNLNRIQHEEQEEFHLHLLQAKKDVINEKETEYVNTERQERMNLMPEAIAEDEFMPQSRGTRDPPSDQLD
jgi:hypothetical protein